MVPKLTKGIVVFDSSGITIYEVIPYNRPMATALISALMGIATEMGLGTAIGINFEASYVYLFSGIKNPELTVAVFSDKPYIENIIVGLYAIHTIDNSINLTPGYITVDMKIKIKAIVDTVYNKVLDISEDFLTKSFIDALKDFEVVLEQVLLDLFLKLKSNIIEILLSNPVKARDLLEDIFGEYGSKQILLKMFNYIQSKMRVKLANNIVFKLVNSTDELEGKKIIRDIIKYIIDEVLIREGVLG